MKAPAFYQSLTRFLHQNIRIVKAILILFFAVGFIGFSLPATHSLFVRLTPFALLMNFALIILYQKEAIKTKTAIAFAFIFLAGFFLELIGTHTGIIFGSYTYGTGLGLKIADTPLMIGINWLMLVWASRIIVDSLPVRPLPAAALAALLMTAYDTILEPLAPLLHMWEWEKGFAPLQNYLAWFVIAFGFHTLLFALKIQLKNKIAPFIFYVQAGFFALLLIRFSLI